MPTLSPINQSCLLMATHSSCWGSHTAAYGWGSWGECSISHQHWGLTVTASQSPCTALTAGNLPAVRDVQGTINSLSVIVEIPMDLQCIAADPGSITVVATPIYIYTSHIQCLIAHWHSSGQQPQDCVTVYGSWSLPALHCIASSDWVHEENATSNLWWEMMR